MGALVALVAYTAWLDIRVRAEFEGAGWAWPARVYARPLEIWPGLRISPATFEDELQRAGYHREAGASRPGSYFREGGRFVLATRRFAFWDSVEPPRRLEVEIANGEVRHLGQEGGAVPIARIDPALIGRIYPGHYEDRIKTRLEDAPPVLVAGLIAVEDRDFFSHHGISFRGIARAVWANVRAGAPVQGGSTLTQQLAKNLFLSPDRTLGRKLTEALMALLLDLRYSKEALLEAYVNEVHLGQEGRRAIHGFGLAAWFYFGRRLDELELSESALLIALVRAPSAYNPRRQSERARGRRDLVLDLLAERGVVTSRSAAAAKARPLGVLARTPRGASPHPAYLDLVRRQLARDYRDGDLRTEGLKIFTALDPAIQAIAEGVLGRQLEALERGRSGAPGALQGALLIARADTGEVVAVVGDRRPRRYGFNRALDARRPIGSLVKPAVYLAALEEGHSLVSPVEDAPITLHQGGGRRWTPRNADDTQLGRIALYRALARSRNTATARLGLEVGLPRVAAVLERLGVTAPIPRVPALLLGSLELSPFEVTQVYQTLSNEGFRAPLRSIREVSGLAGQPLSRYGLSIRKVVDPGPVYLLRAALEAVIREGTARSVRGRVPAHMRPAGKTGTTNGGRDSWFAGFAGDYVAVVWVGYDDNRAGGLSGSGQALEVWAELIVSLPPPAAEPSVPDGVQWYWTVPDGNPRRTDRDCPGAITLPFRRTEVPRYGPC